MKTIQERQPKQQGDVTLQPLSGIPAGAAKLVAKTARGLVLAEGEATGHYHVIDAATDAQLVMIGERMLLQLAEPTTLQHDEHEPIALEPGIWEVGRVREWDYFADMERAVVD